jgi:hypothetical protein
MPIPDRQFHHQSAVSALPNQASARAQRARVDVGALVFRFLYIYCGYIHNVRASCTTASPSQLARHRCCCCCSCAPPAPALPALCCSRSFSALSPSPCPLPTASSAACLTHSAVCTTASPSQLARRRCCCCCSCAPPAPALPALCCSRLSSALSRPASAPSQRLARPHV